MMGSRHGEYFLKKKKKIHQDIGEAYFQKEIYIYRIRDKL